MNLQKLYPSGAKNPFIRGLSNRAAELSKGGNPDLNNPKDIIDWAKVCLYDTVIYCGMCKVYPSSGGFSLSN